MHFLVFRYALDGEQLNKIEKTASENSWYFIKRRYQRIEQRAFFKPVYISDHLKAICTLRVLKVGCTDDYRIVPFVFLPTLTEKDICKIEEHIWKRIQEYRDSNELESVRIEMEQWNNSRSRNRMEFLSFYLSQFLLWTFLELSDIHFYEQKENVFDKEKIRWNYRDMDGIGIEKMVDIFCNEKKSKDLFKEKEEFSLELLLQTWLKDTEDLVPKGICGSFWDEKYENQVRVNQINTLIEDFLFESAAEAEANTHEYATLMIKPMSSMLEYLKRLRNHTLKDMDIGLYQRAKDNPDLYGNFEQISVSELFAAILQMMDNGLMSVVARGKIEDSSEVYEQQIRTCEQAMFVLPKRYLLDIPFFQTMEDKGWLTETYLQNYLNIYYDGLVAAKQYNPDDKAVWIKKWTFFLTLLLRAKQRILYWNISLDRQFVLDNDRLVLL